jgi:hypothetical protein
MSNAGSDKLANFVTTKAQRPDLPIWETDDLCETHDQERAKVCPQETVVSIKERLENRFLRREVGRLTRAYQCLTRRFKILETQSETKLAELQHNFVGSDPKLTEVLELTEKMFPGKPDVSVKRDPEDPENHFIVFTVEFSGTPKDSVQRRLEWHERVGKIPPGSSGSYRLSIIQK